jgi:hypothetical protein
VLSKGLKFIPTIQKIEWPSVFKFFEDYKRKLNLRMYFKDIESSNEIPRFKLPSEWIPPKNHLVERLCDNLKFTIAGLVEEVKDLPRRQNLFKTESAQLKKMIRYKNKSEIFMDTDKHMGLSNTPRVDYIQEGLLHLNDLSTYKPLSKQECDLFVFRTKSQLNKILLDFHHILTKEERQFLGAHLNTFSIPHFYFI